MRQRVRGHRRARARLGAVLAGIIVTGSGVTAGVVGTRPDVAPTRAVDSGAAVSGELALARASSFEVLRPRLRADVGVAPSSDVALHVTEAAAPTPQDERSPATPDVAAGDVAIVPPPPEGFGAVAATAEAPPVELEPTRYDDVTPSGGTWALLVGIDDYPGLRYDLRSAVNDANDVDEALRRTGVATDRRMILRNGQATAGAIRAGVDWLTAHAGPDATLVLFFAGHVQKLEEGTEALVGADGATVTDDELAALLDRSRAQRAWIAIAACYSGGFDEVVRPGRILTAAAPADLRAYENDGFGRSYLVEYMVRRAMLADGITTIEGAFARAVEQLRRDHPDRIPVQIDRVEGDLDLARRPAAPAPAPEPAEPAPPPPPPPSSTPPPEDDESGCAALTLGMVRCRPSS